MVVMTWSVGVALTLSQPIMFAVHRDEIRQTSSCQKIYHDWDEIHRETDPTLLTQLAKALYQAGDPEQALELVDRAIQTAGPPVVVSAAYVTLVGERPSDSAAADRLATRGVMLLTLGKTQAGVDCLMEALNADPDHFDTNNAVAQYCLATEQYAHAERYFTRAAATCPTRADVRARLGLTRSKLQQSDARAELDAAIRLDPLSADPWAMRAQVHLEAGEWAAAIHDFTTALSHDFAPDCVIGLAQARLANGDAAGAERAVTVGLAIIPEAADRAKLLEVRAEARQVQNDPDRARADRERAAELQRVRLQARP